MGLGLGLELGLGLGLGFHGAGELGGGGGEGRDLHGGDGVELAGRSDGDEVEALTTKAYLVRGRGRGRGRAQGSGVGVRLGLVPQQPHLTGSVAELVRALGEI